MIHPNSCQKRNSPSPTWGKLEGVLMAHDKAYYQAEKKIEEARCTLFLRENSCIIYQSNCGEIYAKL